MLQSSLASFVIFFIITANIEPNRTCPHESNIKSTHKSDEIVDQQPLTSMDLIKLKLKNRGIFDWEDPTLTNRERKEMKKMFDAVEIMLTSRQRQPGNVQSVFASLRVVERVMTKLLKDGQISESLADRFEWDKLTNRKSRDILPFHVHNTTRMRMFN